MWFTLALATLTCLIVLYVPGFLLGRALTLDSFAALAVAPAFTVCGLTILGVIFYHIGLHVPGLALAMAVLAIAIVAACISWLVQRKSPCALERVVAVDDAKRAWKTAALYIAVAFVITFVVFIVSIHTPDGFCRRDDNTVHLSLIRGFLDTNSFSTLDVSVFMDLNGNTEYYPAAWHVLVAVVASMFGDGVALATNAAIIACTAVVFPLAMCMLMLRLFKGNRIVLLSGCLFPAAFCGFPWGFLVRGQLCPNMLSYMFVPLVLVLLIELVNTPGMRKRICLACSFLISLLAIALAHPNGAFVFGIWAVLWGVSRFFYAPGEDRAKLTAGRIIGSIVLFAVACGVWYALFKMPQLQSTVAYGTLPRASWPKELVAGLLFRFSNQEGIQPLLSILTLVGIIYTCRHRKYLWLTVAYLAALAFFVIDASTEGFIKQLLTGFWYSDATRTGAVAALYAMPLATMGFAWAVRGLGTILAGRQENALLLREKIAAAVLIILLALSQFLPFHYESGGKSIDLGLEKIRYELNFFYSWNSGLTAEEDAFIKRAMEEIPEGAMVINLPTDGSCWSYGVEGINTYFRRTTNRGFAGIEKSKILRKRLKDVAKDGEVQELLKELDARYLLLLDDASSENRTVVDTPRYEAKNWTGIETITEDTPGFELILSDGDMRLYEIVW